MVLHTTSAFWPTRNNDSHINARQPLSIKHVSHTSPCTIIPRQLASLMTKLERTVKTREQRDRTLRDVTVPLLRCALQRSCAAQPGKSRRLRPEVSSVVLACNFPLFCSPRSEHGPRPKCQGNSPITYQRHESQTFGCPVVRSVPFSVRLCFSLARRRDLLTKL